jgi:putative copper export protein
MHEDADGVRSGRRGRPSLRGGHGADAGAAGPTRGMRNLPGLAVSLWLGVMAFFAFVVAPAAFATLEREAAGRLVSAIFPRYYQAGAVLGLLAVGTCLSRSLLRGWRALDWLPLGLVTLMLALTLYAWLVVLPAAHAAREDMRRPEAGQASPAALRFARLHRLSSVLNAVVLLAGVAALATEVTRQP